MVERPPSVLIVDSLRIFALTNCSVLVFAGNGSRTWERVLRKRYKSPLIRAFHQSQQRAADLLTGDAGKKGTSIMCKETSADGNCCHIVTTSTTSAVTTTTTIIDTINNFSAHFSTGKHWYNDNMGYHKQEQQTDECQCDLHHRLHQYQQHFSACKCGPYGDSQKGLAGRNCCYAKGRIIPAVVNIAGKSAMPRKAKRTKTKRTKWHKFIHSLTSYFHTNILLFLVLFTSGVHSQANAPLEYYLSEELPADTVVGNLVQDLSLDTQYTQEELDQMRFTVSDNTGQSNLDYFAIDNIGGIIKTTKSIDREEICFTSIECSVNLKVLVSPAQYFQVIKVIVHITDRNDHVPTFPQRTFSKSIPETTLPGAAFPLPIADDFDSGVFGVQRYRLYGDRSKFSLRITNGSDGIIEDIRLLLLQSLDREEQESYAMRVVASDGGTPPESGTMSILITVTDTNDNNPKFDNDTYEVVIPENTASHTTIVQVHASDPDSGRNGEIMYSFAEDTLNKYGDLFEIDSLTGEIYLSRVVDYEEGEIYYLSAVARDRGDNSLPAFARVVVKVRDVNDHAPHITLNFLEEDQEIAQVLENSDIGTFVAHVSVSDPDGGRMGQVTCSMQSPYFQLEQLSTAANEYKIVTRVVFDREVRGNYEVTVKCEDKGQPPLEAIEAIPIFIIDENDHQPQFWKSLYRSTILENNDKQAYIARVNATDGDSDGNAAIKYELANNEDKKVLYVDPINGIITAKVSFDYEKQSEYSFPLIAYDQGTPSRTATTTLSLSIIDRNDEPPKFTENSYVFSVQEGQDGDAPVGQVTATDEDSHPFNDVKYSFWKDPGGASELFKIDELTGTIRTKVKLDREEKSEYRLKVLASNEGFQDMTSTVDVTIKVGDENDNAPIFDFPNSYNNTLQVAVLLPKGRVVAQARAHDPDMDSNSQITFSLANDNNTFKIDPKNGYITVEAKLTEVECKICKMWVIATDSGQKPKSSREEVSIILSAGFGKTSSQKSSHVYLSPTELIIICAVGSSVVLIIVVIIIIFTVKRCDKNKQKKQQYTAGTHHDNSVEPEESSTASKCSDCCSPGHVGGGGGGGAIDLMQQKPSQNGQCGKTGGDRPKKEVKFLMDNGGTHTGESSTDDFPPSWPSHIGSDLIQNPKAHSTALGSSDSSEVQDDDKLGPLWHDQPGAWNQANHHRNPAGTSGALPVPPPPPPPATCITRSSPVAPLTEMELEMHEMLQMFGRDKDSETGSFTDSGRGPSEEGDTRPCPLDPKLNDDHKGAMLRSTDHSQRGIGNHYRPSDSTMGRRLNALPKSSSFGTAPGMKNFCLHDRGAHPTIHGVKPPMYNTSYIPVPSVDKVHRMQHQHSADSTGSGSESGVTWSDTNKVTNHRSPSRGAGVGGGVSGQLPARTGILKFAHTNRRPNDPSGGSKTLPHKSGSLDSGIQGGPEANRQHIPVPNTFQGPYHGNIDKQRSQPSSVAGSRAGSSQSLNVNPQPMYQGQGHMNRNSFYNNSRTLSPSHRTCSSSLQGAQNPLMDADSKSRSPKLDRLPGASSQVYPSKGLYDNPSRYGAKTADWGNESVLSDDGTCASTTSGSYMVEPDNISQDTTTRSSFRDDKKDPLHQQTMV